MCKILAHLILHTNSKDKLQGIMVALFNLKSNKGAQQDKIVGLATAKLVYTLDK